MESFNKDPSLKRFRKLEKIMKRQKKIQKKAATVMSKQPPGPEFVVNVRAKYFKPVQKIELPPIKLKAKANENIRDNFRTPIPQISKRPTKQQIGILQGTSKNLTKRLHSKSIEFKQMKNSQIYSSFSHNSERNHVFTSNTLLYK